MAAKLAAGRQPGGLHGVRRNPPPLQRLEAGMSPASGVEVFYDGECPLCMREIRMLMRLDRHGSIRFTNIAAPDFVAAAVGKTMTELMARIHGRTAEGQWIEGVEVFRQLYAAVGFTRLVAISRWPVIAQLLTLGYTVFARNRLRLTGRSEACGPGCAIPARDQGHGTSSVARVAARPS
jgi:predicted DCC family thiol-disulfide oxidoreductase YuxK